MWNWPLASSYKLMDGYLSRPVTSSNIGTLSCQAVAAGISLPPLCLLKSCSRVLPCCLHTSHAHVSGSVTEAEAQKWEEHREEREQRAADLKQRLLQQYRQRGQAPPEVLVSDSS